MSPKRQINFIGIGAPRSASTWLSQCLYEHPQISFPTKHNQNKLHPLDKEQNFFSQSLFRRNYSQKDRYLKGINWYLDNFNWSKPNQTKGEFSVAYLADPKAPFRIKKHFPNIKIIAILRNPVDMIYSAYHHLKALVHTQVPPDFQQAILQNNTQKLRLPWGLYHQHLQAYYHHFPSKNIQVFLYDQVINNPKDLIKQAYNFLQVDSSFSPPSLNKKRHSAVKTKSPLIKNLSFTLLNTLEKLKLKQLHHKLSRHRRLYNLYHHLNLTPTTKPPLSQPVKNKLYQYYKKDINKLEKLINTDLSSWKNV